jgi:hypothetical protein
MHRALLITAGAFCGCVGEADWAIGSAGGLPIDDPSNPAVHVGAFHGLSGGLPAEASLAGTAQLDGVLYTVANGGLYRLPSGLNQWELVAVPSSATSVTRIETAIWVTAGDGVYRLGFADDAFARVSSQPGTQLVKKGSELLMATASGLMASSDRGASWTLRSTHALFAQVTALVASPAAVRMFALSDKVLWQSDDAGASWSSGLVAGDVTAVDAAAEFVLVQSASGALRSDNYGNTFHAVQVGSDARAFAIAQRQAFAGTMSGLRVSDDSGLSWRDSNDGLPAGSAVLQLFLSGSSLVASTGSGVYVAQVQ